VEVTLLETSLETGVEEAALVVDLVEVLVDETEPVLETEPVPTKGNRTLKFGSPSLSVTRKA
jgi:hypothetical protein